MILEDDGMGVEEGGMIGEDDGMGVEEGGMNIDPGQTE